MPIVASVLVYSLASVAAAGGLNLHELWRTARTTTLGRYTAPAANGLVFVPAGRTIEARELASGAIVWAIELTTPVRAAAVVGPTLWVGGVASPSQPDLHALHLQTGQLQVAIAAGGVFANPVGLAGGVVVASTHRLLLTRRGAVEWEAPFARTAAGYPGGPGLGGVAAWRDWVFAAGQDRRLAALDATTGTQVWQVVLPGRLMAPPQVAADLLVLAVGAEVWALDAASGTLRWRAPLPGHPGVGGVLVDGGRVWVGSGTHETVEVLRLSDGVHEHTVPLGAPCFATPVAGVEAIWVGAGHQLVALDPATANERGRVGCDLGPLLGPTVIGDTIVVGSTAGQFVAFTRSTPTPNAAPRVSPNPARTAVQLGATAGPLRIFDAQGRLCWQRPGAPRATQWDLRDASGARLPAGVYFLVVDGAPGSPAQKLVIAP